MRALVALAGVSLLLAGCGGGGNYVAKDAAPAKVTVPRCAFPGGWQRLANKIGASVYCPGWLPDPLTSQIGGTWNNIDSVSKDRSYLESFVWQETGMGAAGGELHVNLRGYPGKLAIPMCPTGAGNSDMKPCFDQPKGTVDANGIKATLYTVNQGADQWHVALAWHHQGSLYTLSEHLAPPLNYRKLVQYLRHELRSLVLIEPARST